MVDLLTGALGAFIVLFVMSPRKTYEAPTIESEKIITQNQSGKPGVRFKLSSIHFIGGSTELNPDSHQKLEQLSEYLKQKKNMKLMIEGHVNTCGSVKRRKEKDSYWQELSEGRAKRIYHYLINDGISPSRLHYRGLGGTKPINEHPQSMREEAENRRVEFLILDK